MKARIAREPAEDCNEPLRPPDQSITQKDARLARRISELTEWLIAHVRDDITVHGPDEATEDRVWKLKDADGRIVHFLRVTELALDGERWWTRTVRMAPNEPAQQGRAAIQAAHEASRANVTKLSITPSEIDGLDGLAYVRGTYSITFAEGMAEPLTETGKYIWILRQQPDGSWLEAAVIWNHDQPLPEQGSGTEQ